MSAIQVLWKHWGKRRNCSSWATSPFPFNVFYPFVEFFTTFIKFKIVVCKLFHFGRIQILSFSKGLNKSCLCPVEVPYCVGLTWVKGQGRMRTWFENGFQVLAHKSISWQKAFDRYSSPLLIAMIALISSTSTLCMYFVFPISTAVSMTKTSIFGVPLYYDCRNEIFWKRGQFPAEKH